jgi:hypothetical protein
MRSSASPNAMTIGVALLQQVLERKHAGERAGTSHPGTNRLPSSLVQIATPTASPSRCRRR